MKALLLLLMAVIAVEAIADDITLRCPTKGGPSLFPEAVVVYKPSDKRIEIVRGQNKKQISGCDESDVLLRCEEKEERVIKEDDYYENGKVAYKIYNFRLKSRFVWILNKVTGDLSFEDYIGGGEYYKKDWKGNLILTKTEEELSKFSSLVSYQCHRSDRLFK